MGPISEAGHTQKPKTAGSFHVASYRFAIHIAAGEKRNSVVSEAASADIPGHADKSCDLYLPSDPPTFTHNDIVHIISGPITPLWPLNSGTHGSKPSMKKTKAIKRYPALLRERYSGSYSYWMPPPKRQTCEFRQEIILSTFRDACLRVAPSA